MIVVDTHVVAWLALEPEKLSSVAVGAIAAARQNGGVCISDITLWELSMLATRNRIALTTSLESFLREVEANFIIFPISSAIAHRSTLFTNQYPADPADRMIGATALVKGLPLVTRDERIHQSNEVTVVW